MKFIYYGGTEKIKKAVDRANKITSDSDFYLTIKHQPDFTFTDVSPAVISENIKMYNYRIVVKDYWKPFAFAFAYFTPADPDSIYINRAKLGRPTNSVVNTIVHEGVHVVDNWNKMLDYGHGSNSPEDKELSAPYWIGGLAQRFANKMYGHELYRPTTWQKIKNFFRRIF